MSYGWEVYDANGDLSFTSESNYPNIKFFAGVQSVSSSDVTPSYAGYSNLSSVVTRSDDFETPIDVLGIVHGYYAGFYKAPRNVTNINAVGVVSGGKYYAPSKGLTHSNSSPESKWDLARIVEDCKVNARSGKLYTFGSFTPKSEGYGGIAYDASGRPVVTTETPPLYFQPTSTGALTHSVSLSSLGNTNTRNDINKYTHTQYLTWKAQAATITFGQAYTHPPLIFLSDSEGVPVAIYGYKKNTAGKYTGVVLTTHTKGTGTFCTNCPYQSIAWSSRYRFGASVSTTAKVLVVSEEYPEYITHSGHGIKTFDSNSRIIFDSDVSLPFVFSDTVNLPYLRVKAYGKYSTGSASHTEEAFGGSTITKSGTNRAVCLNSFHAVTGLMFRVGVAEWWGPDYVYQVYGRYVSATKSSGNTVFGVTAEGSMSYNIADSGGMKGAGSRSYGHFPAVSFDAHKGRVSTFDVISCSF